MTMRAINHIWKGLSHDCETKMHEQIDILSNPCKFVIWYFEQYSFENNITKSTQIHAYRLPLGNKNVNQLLSKKSRWSWLTRSNGRLVSVGPRWAQIDHVCHRAGHADRDQGWSPLPTTPNYSTPHSCSTPNTRQCSTRLYSNQLDISYWTLLSVFDPFFQEVG